MGTDFNNMSGNELNVTHISELPGVAKKLLSSFPDHRIFAFYGKMGAGKTTFIKALCAQLGVADKVTSPTFALINVYNSGDNGEIYHFDFYRINDLKEVMDIGYEEYFFSGNYCFLEWPENIEDILPDETLRINLKVAPDESRILEIR